MSSLSASPQPRGERGEHLRSPLIEGMMQEAGLCPFCGARPGAVADTRFVCVRRGSHGIPYYYVRCWMCGCNGPSEATPQEAIDVWSRRPSKQWTPLPDQSFMLADTQAYQNLLVLDDGATVKLIDWEGEEVHAQVEFKLGHFRLCVKR